MESYKLTLLLVTWLYISHLGTLGYQCPKRCKCSQITVQCIGAGLKTLPSEIPSSIRYLDLSENPLIKFQNNSFARFTQLEKLVLRECSIKDPFILPKNLRIIDMSWNHLSLQAVEELFKEERTPNVKEITLKSNGIILVGKLSIFPRSVTNLNLVGNVLQKIGRSDLNTMKNLRFLFLSSTGLQSIAKGAFDQLKDLRVLKMNTNKLNFLPAKLFQHNRNLGRIQINDNRLKALPDLTGIRSLVDLRLKNNLLKMARNLNVRSISSLDLSFNLIESYNFSKILVLTLDLSHNKLKMIEKNTFPKLSNVFAIYLQSNNIKSIAINAFEGIEYIGDLFLHRNQLKNLPKGIFNGLSIKKLSLFANELSTVDGIFQGVKIPPYQLLLFGNKLKSIRSSDFQKMPNGSQIYISCTSLDECIGAGLKTLPSEIPSSIRYLDLSENPLIKFQNNSFARFTQLEKLVLRECSIKDTFILPKSLRIIDMSGNQLNVEAVEELFKEERTPNLKEIALRSNNIILDGQFSIFPRSVTNLNLDGNVLQKIGRSDLNTLKKLRSLILSHTGLQSIAKGAFDQLKDLRVLEINTNKLTYLPAKTFQHNRNLGRIEINDNRLKALPDLTGIRSLVDLHLKNNLLKMARNLNVRSISSLDLSFNLIESYNFSKILVLTLDLSHNKLKMIEKNTFPKLSNVFAIYLQSNNIKSIAINAFEGIEYIGDLFLHRNQLKNLQKGIFNGLSIKKLSLFANELSTVDGIFQGVKTPPYQLLLFGNKLKSIRSSDFQKMPNGSQIYISCNSLDEVPNHFDINPKVICSPTRKLVIKTATTALEGDGFQCFENLKVRYHFDCKPCQVGYYGNDGCIACPAGAFYQDEMAAIACKPCPLGQFVPLDKAPGKSPLQCLTCPFGTNTNSSAAYRACKCLPGFARSHRFQGCTKCTQEGFSCQTDYKELTRGYWMSWQTMQSASNTSCKTLYKAFMQNLDTKNDTYDRATIKYDCHMPTAHKCPLQGSCLGGIEADCKQGYTGILCAVCQGGYMKNFGKFTKCPSSVVAVVQCVAFFLAFVFICWLMSKVDKVKLAGNDSKTFADLILSTLKILIGFYQVLVGIIHALPNIHWPGNLTKAVRVFEFIQFSIFHIPALHCIKREWRMDAIKEFWFAIIATATVPFIICIYTTIKSLCSYCCVRDTVEFRTRLRKNVQQCLEAIFLFLFATYPLTSSKIFQIQPASCHAFCTSEKDGQCLHRVSYLRSDYRVSCTSGTSDDVIVTKAANEALILPFGFPLLLLFLLWRLAPKKNTDDAQRQQPAGSINDDGEEAAAEESVVAVALRLFYGNYKPESWYWEVTEMARKLIISIASALVLHNIKIGLFGLIILSILFAVAHARMWPMKDKFDNLMQLLALVIVAVNLCYGVTQNSAIGDDEILEQSKDKWGLGVMLVSLNSLLLVLLFGRLFWEILRKICNSRLCETSCSQFGAYSRNGDLSENLLEGNGSDIIL
eukprot:gene15848-7175_t